MSGQAEIQKMSRCVQNARALIGTGKKCATCKQIKNKSAFYARKTTNDGLCCYCKECEKIASARRYKDNPGKYKLWSSRYKKNNPEKILAAAKLWAKNNPEKALESYRKADAKKISTPKGKLNKNLSRLIRHTMHGNKNGRHWEALVGYTTGQLKRHLEKQFKSGMTWENYGMGGWHIDHRIPISAFNFNTDTDDDFRKCWALSNLQPMWAGENIKKSNKLTTHFQPSLKF